MLQGRLSTLAGVEDAFHYWGEAVDRAGFREGEIFSNAFTDTHDLPTARERWSAFVHKHPAVALVYARLLPTEQGREFFDLWCGARGFAPGEKPSESEFQAFYDLARKMSNPGQLTLWMAHYPERKLIDGAIWAALLHGWHDEAAAWQVISESRPEPAWPAAPAGMTQEQLERRWQKTPENLLIAQGMAAFYFQAGQIGKARAVIYESARREKAPEWFTRKAAYALAAQSRLAEAVEMLLKEEHK